MGLHLSEVGNKRICSWDHIRDSKFVKFLWATGSKSYREYRTPIKQRSNFIAIQSYFNWGTDTENKTEYLNGRAPTLSIGRKKLSFLNKCKNYPLQIIKNYFCV